jgi:hypothetical protein
MPPEFPECSGRTVGSKARASTCDSTLTAAFPAQDVLFTPLLQEDARRIANLGEALTECRHRR